MENLINMESILISTKKLSNVYPDCTDFDPDIILFLNGLIAVATQVGIGPEEGFFITGDTETWTQFIGSDPKLNMVKTWLALRVRKQFDPPTNPTILQALKDEIAEFEWRMGVANDSIG